MLPSWWNDKADRQKQNRRSARQERQRAKQTGGRTQPGSGSSYRAPQDVRTPLDEDERGFLEENKYTDGHRFSFDIRKWIQSRGNAHRSGREPRWVLDFPEFQTRLVINEEEYPSDGA